MVGQIKGNHGPTLDKGAGFDISAQQGRNDDFHLMSALQ